MSQVDPNTGFDEQVLGELREDMGEAMLEFVQAFLESLDETRLRMREALGVGRLDTVAESAHRLKGTAGYLGAVELVATLAEIQQRCRMGGPAQLVEPLVDRMEELDVAVRARLQPLAKE